jgi:hypothetical protein
LQGETCLTTQMCAGDGRTVFDLKQEQESRRKNRKHKLKLKQPSWYISDDKDEKANDTRTELVGLFDDISKWHKAHSNEWFRAKNSMESGQLFQLIEQEVFGGRLEDVKRGFLRAMLLAEAVLVNGQSRSWDKMQIAPEDLKAALLSCSRAIYSSSSELDDIRRQMYDSAWVRFGASIYTPEPANYSVMLSLGLVNSKQAILQKRLEFCFELWFCLECVCPVKSSRRYTAAIRSLRCSP